MVSLDMLTAMLYSDLQRFFVCKLFAAILIADLANLLAAIFVAVGL